MAVANVAFEDDTNKSSLTTLFNPNVNLVSSKGVIYTWQNLTVKSQLKNRNRFLSWSSEEPNLTKTILNNVSGFSLPGELVAILGASGAGKSTLLNALNMQNLTGLIVEGERKVNGRVINAKSLTSISAYVQQEDIFIGTLTVREHLVFQAEVRMNSSFSMESRLARVEELLNEMSLVKCADVLIGVKGRIKGISGGEAKRLAFASEIITHPSIMFCDEPTSGLDSYMAQNIVEVLRNKAHQGNTIICTIHQPSSQIYEMFDKIMLMAEGRLAFSGTPDQAQALFENCGFVLPLHYNPADFYIQTLAIIHNQESECKEKVAQICNEFEISEFGRNMLTTLESYANSDNLSTTAGNTTSTFSSSPYKVSWFSQFCAVLQRTFKATSKEPMIIKFKFIITVLVSLITGYIFFGQSLNQEGIMNINGAIFLVIIGQTFEVVFGLVLTFCTEIPLFLREHRNGLYRVDIYFIAKQIIDFPIYLLTTFIKITIIYWMVGMNSEPMRFLIAVSIHFALIQTTTSFAYMISCLSPSFQIANTVAPMIIQPFLLLGGFFLNSISIPPFIAWIKYLSWFNYANQALCINQWEGVQNIQCNRPPNTTAHEACIKNGDQVLAMLNFNPNDFLLNIILLLVLAVCYRLIAFFGLLFRARYRK